jgi:hypothetical protein
MVAPAIACPVAATPEIEVLEAVGAVASGVLPPPPPQATNAALTNAMEARAVDVLLNCISTFFCCLIFHVTPTAIQFTPSNGTHRPRKCNVYYHNFTYLLLFTRKSPNFVNKFSFSEISLQQDEFSVT